MIYKMLLNPIKTSMEQINEKNTYNFQCLDNRIFRLSYLA